MFKDQGVKQESSTFDCFSFRFVSKILVIPNCPDLLLSASGVCIAVSLKKCCFLYVYYYLYLCFGQIPGDTWNNLMVYSMPSLLLLPPFSWFCSVFSHSVAGSHKNLFWLIIKGIFGMVKLPLTLALTDTVSLDESCINECSLPSLLSPFPDLVACCCLYRDGIGLKEGKQYSLFPRLPKLHRKQIMFPGKM